MNTFILDLVERDDFMAELREHGIQTIRVEIESQIGAPRGEWGNAPHTVYAVATALRPSQYGAVLVRHQTTILVTDSLTLRMDNGDSRKKMFKNFDRVQAEFVAAGFTVKRGQWKAS